MLYYLETKFMDIFSPLLTSLGLSIGIGVLVGLERESYRQSGANTIAGLRTFIFISVWGFLTGVIAQTLFMAFLPVSFFCLVVTLVAVYYSRESQGEKHGLTTEMAAIVTFLLASLSLQLDHSIILALGVLVALALSTKNIFIRWLTVFPREAVLATVQFAVLSAVVLPFLPNQYMGPWHFFNPYVAWWMVVLVSGISFVGYVLNLIFSSRNSILVSAAIGGLVSSTAVTTSMSQLSKHASGSVSLFITGCIVASSIASLRVLTTASIIYRPIFFVLVLPMFLLAIIGSIFAWRIYSKKVTSEDKVSFNNPFQIGSAITFAILFVVISFLARTSTGFLGIQGLYLTSLFAGVADVDAMTISASQLASFGTITASQASITVLLVFLSNMIVKCAITLVFGHRNMRKLILTYTGVVLFIILLAVLFLHWSNFDV